MNNPALFVRAINPSTGAHQTVTALYAEQVGWRTVNRPALDQHGRPLPPKPRTFSAAPMPEATVSANPEETE